MTNKYEFPIGEIGTIWDGLVELYAVTEANRIPVLGVTESVTSCPIEAWEAEGIMVPPVMLESTDTGRGVQSSWMLLYSNMFQFEKYVIREPHGTNKVATGEMFEKAFVPNVGGIVPKAMIVLRFEQFVNAPFPILATELPMVMDDMSVPTKA